MDRAPAKIKCEGTQAEVCATRALGDGGGIKPPLQDKPKTNPRVNPRANPREKPHP
jgi:hypothetical protein